MTQLQMSPDKIPDPESLWYTHFGASLRTKLTEYTMNPGMNLLVKTTKDYTKALK